MSLTQIDWSTLPVPEDDGGAAHLTGRKLPDVSLPSTDGIDVHLSTLMDLTVIYVYPMTARPDRNLPDGWDSIPGARGCTPQSCAFRDHFAELSMLGVRHVYGVSAQTTAYQKEAVDRLHLPFPLLSDAGGDLRRAASLPAMTVDEMTLLKRMTLISRNGIIERVFYPVFPPDRNAQDVMDWLRSAA